MRYQNQIKSKDGNTYSCDMVRLNFDMGSHTQEFVSWVNHISACDLRYEVKYFPAYSQFKYRHLWTFTDVVDGCSWSLGLDLGTSADAKNKGYLEFNPNKCYDIPTFTEFWQIFAEYTYCGRELVRYDLAVDVPLSRHLVKLVRTGKYKYRLHIEDDGITEYTGSRNKSGFVKVYDKTKESKLDYDLTRVELTLDRDDIPTDKAPTVWLYDEQTSIQDYSQLSDTQIVLVDLIRQSDAPNVYLNRLQYRVRKKIEPYFADRVLSFDVACCNQVRQFALSFES